jgi:hypothetical protein
MSRQLKPASEARVGSGSILLSAVTRHGTGRMSGGRIERLRGGRAVMRAFLPVVSVKFSNLTMVLGDRVVNLLYQSRP